MNKRKHSACMAALTALAMVFLGGCQLAVPEGEETDAGQDRLTGVFVTTEYLDLFDMESWINDNIGDIMKGGAAVSAADSGKYGGRLYAELVEEAFTDSMGETQFRHDYVFPGLEGMFYGTFLIKPENHSMAEAEGYWLSTGSDGMLSLKNHHKTTDEGEELEQEAVIYIPSDRGEVCFYFNPVYQTPDGAVYLTAGQGMAANGIHGGAMSQTMTGTGTLREGDEVKSFSSKISITVDGVDVPDRVVLIRMDEAHRELGRTELVPGAFPESLTPEAGTAYILMETHCGGEVSRSLLQPGDRAAEAFYRMENDICNKDYVQILWSEK